MHIDVADAGVAHEICRRLDGIPLAIELAAAQLASLELDELAAALDVALGVLTGGARTNPSQETMLRDDRLEPSTFWMRTSRLRSSDCPSSPAASRSTQRQT